MEQIDCVSTDAVAHAGTDRFGTVEVRDDTGRQVAFFTGSGMVVDS